MGANYALDDEALHATCGQNDIGTLIHPLQPQPNMQIGYNLYK